MGMPSDLLDACLGGLLDCGGVRALGRFLIIVVVFCLLMKIVGLAFLV